MISLSSSLHVNYPRIQFIEYWMFGRRRDSHLVFSQPFFKQVFPSLLQDGPSVSSNDSECTPEYQSIEESEKDLLEGQVPA